MFCDGALENVAVRIGERLKGDMPAAQDWLDAVRRTMDQVEVLHVATSIPEVGGHARLLERWVKLDERSAAVLLLAHGTDPCRSGLDAVAGRAARCTSCHRRPGDSALRSPFGFWPGKGPDLSFCTHTRMMPCRWPRSPMKSSLLSRL
ncbi:MAG: hypothetical protein IPP94_09220 [Ignavibacteria bacterium]|nr:hypothetical protein [Ignavibacteria bacterium]